MLPTKALEGGRLQHRHLHERTSARGGTLLGCHTRGPRGALPTLPHQPGFHGLGCATAGMDTGATSHLPGGPGRGTVRAAKRGRGLRPEADAILRPGHAPNPGESGKARGKQGGIPAPRGRLRKAGGARPGPRQSSLEEKRERGNRREARLGSPGRGRGSRRRCPAGRPHPCTRRALAPRGRGVPSHRPRPSAAASAAGALPAAHGHPLRPTPPRRDAGSEAPAAASPLTALRAGYAAGGDGSSRRRSSRCGGRDMLGRAAIYSGRKRRGAALGRRSPAAAAQAPAPQSGGRAGAVSRPGGREGRGGGVSAPSPPPPGVAAPGWRARPGPAGGARLSRGLVLPRRCGGDGEGRGSPHPPTPPARTCGPAVPGVQWQWTRW